MPSTTKLKHQGYTLSTELDKGHKYASARFDECAILKDIELCYPYGSTHGENQFRQYLNRESAIKLLNFLKECLDE